MRKLFRSLAIVPLFALALSALPAPTSPGDALGCYGPNQTVCPRPPCGFIELCIPPDPIVVPYQPTVPRDGEHRASRVSRFAPHVLSVGSAE
jgi:hypothetical protein